MKDRVLVAVGAKDSNGPVSTVSFLVRLRIKKGARFVLNICAGPGVTLCHQGLLRDWY